MINLKPSFRDNESVLGEYGATIYRLQGSLVRGSNVRLWLTNQRIILKAALGPQRTLPLYAIVGFREEKVSWYTMIRLEFTSGHLEWLTVQNQTQFLETLKTAQAQAPEIPESVSTATTSLGITALFGSATFFVIIIGMCVFFGACLFIAAFGGLWIIAQTP